MNGAPECHSVSERDAGFEYRRFPFFLALLSKLYYLLI